MAEYNNSYTNGNGNEGGRFGHRYKTWKASNDTRWKASNDTQTDSFAYSDANRDHICKPVIVGPDGRERPLVLDCPPMHHRKETTTMYEESAYRAQPASPYSTEYMPADRRTGFSGGMFQRQRPGYGSAEPALIRKAELAPPSPNRVMEYLTGSAGPVSDAGWAQSSQNTSADYSMGSTRPISDVRSARSGPTGWKTPPPSEGRLGKVTNDIGTAVDYLRGPVGPTTTGWYSGQNNSADYLMGSSKPASARSGPTGLKTPPLPGQLGKVINDIGMAAEYLKGSVEPSTAATKGQWGPSGVFSEFGGRKVSGAIDSREVRKKYNGQYM